MRGGDEKILRSADWRFLLPMAEQECALDVTDQRLAGLLPANAGSATDGACDLVVGTDPQVGQIERAFASLRPGGVCYFEWRAQFRPSSGALRRRLEAAGFRNVRLYWSWPPAIPSVWVPLEAPAAARWVLRRRHRTLAGLGWRVAHAAHLVRPRCVTAARPPCVEDAGPLGVALGDLEGEPFWALLAPGSAALNKLVAFVGTRGHDDPSLILKMPRTEAAIAPLEREAAALERLHSAVGSLDGVPRLLSYHRNGDELRAIAESALNGRPLLELLDRRRYPALARQATGWLATLAQIRPGPVERRTTAVELATQAAADAAPADGELLIEAGRLASSADSLPVVFEHRDFSPWNVCVDRGGGLVVFDWESAEPNGYPALDLVYLLAYCGFQLDRVLHSGTVRQSYRRTFEGSLARECLARYGREVGVDLERVPAVRTLTWLVHLRAALRRDPAGADSALFLDLLREEVRVRSPDAPRP